MSLSKDYISILLKTFFIILVLWFLFWLCGKIFFPSGIGGMGYGALAYTLPLLSLIALIFVLIICYFVFKIPAFFERIIYTSLSIILFVSPIFPFEIFSSFENFLFHFSFFIWIFSFAVIIALIPNIWNFISKWRKSL